MKNIDAKSHVTGTSVYTDDIPELEGTLYVKVIGSSIAHGKIKSINSTNAREFPGVKHIVFAEDIPGENQIGGIIQDEELLSSGEVHYIGHPIGFILAESKDIANKACKMVTVTYEELEAIFDSRVAKERGSLIQPPRIFQSGNVDQSWSKCDFIVTGETETAGQEHLYIEGQVAYALPQENGDCKIYSSTQGPTQVQRAAAKVLGISMHKIEVEVRRIGGGFGGKEDQATGWGCMVALGSYISNKPVKLVLERHEDMKMTGKRHPYKADYKLGLTKEGKILAYEVTFYQNAGASADLSPAILERTLFHAANSYYIPNMRATGYSCRTNQPSFTAFRGFGGPQGMFVIEAALNHASEKMNISIGELQKINFIKFGEKYYYGQKYAEVNFDTLHYKLFEVHSIQREINRISEFNQKNKRYKKGYYIMPVSFGISFTNTGLNQAGALVHIYQDGSISVSTGAVEMGQGVNTRILQVPIRVFNLPENYVKIETTNTTRVANTSPSAASSTHDLNGKATEIACNEILSRLLKFTQNHLQLSGSDLIEIREAWVYVNGKRSDLSWKQIVNMAHWKRIDLSAHAHFATPDIHFDKTKEQGQPFAYHAVGIAFLEVTVDCLKGIYVFDQVKVIHDFGTPLNKEIDLGQMEGGIVQGLGWMTIEDLQWGDDGKLLANALSTYKVPDRSFVPKVIETHFLENSESNGLFKSKAIGEPPLMYGIGGFFALRNAIKAYNPGLEVEFITPMTPERLFMYIWSSIEVKTQINQ